MDQLKNGVGSKGAEAKTSEREEKTLTLGQVKKMVARDLPTAISFLQACMDPDIQDQVSIFLHGKYLNAKHKEELDAQTHLDIVKDNR